MFTLFLVFSLGVQAPGADPAGIDFFEKRVRPVLAENCFQCHGPLKQKANLRLDQRDSVFRGGGNGALIVPGQPNESRLLLAVRYTNVDLQMPPRGKLSGSVISDLEAWIRMGAPWPADARSGGPSAEPRTFDVEKRKREHWSWQPLGIHEPPIVKDTKWPRSREDQFLLASLEAQGLAPAPEAERSDLIRRLAYDLTGLPPEPAEVEAYRRDAQADAHERLVDRLLESPRFGEHWARRWFDLVRYSETLGHEHDYPLPNAWRYRDYVIEALNSDVPFDQFLREHVAGDLIETPRRGVSGENESVKGTAFYWFGQQTIAPLDPRQQTVERIENQIDVLTKTFLGLTVACARCHDHKFDAISTQDYYALYGFLASSRYTQAHVDPEDRIAAKAGRLASLHHELGQALMNTSHPPEHLGVREGDVILADFGRAHVRGERWDGWLPEGPAFGHSGEFCPELAFSGSADLPEIRAFRGGWANSGALSTRLQGALRSPSFKIERQFLHALVAGRDSRMNIIVDGFGLIRSPIYGDLKQGLEKESAHWITVDLGMWAVRQAVVELSDLEPRDLGDKYREAGYGPSGWIAASWIGLSDSPCPPLEVSTGRLIERRKPTCSRESAPRARSLWAEYRKIEESIPAPTLLPAMADGSGEDVPVFLRGNPKITGEVAERRFLVALCGSSQPPVGKGSGRLELARRMLDPSNPFVTRVFVNRIWHQIFGRGLVPTVDDFGVLGQKPSHPELLDALAVEFRNDGWSLKRLVRRLVTSSAYRMSSASRDPRAEKLDPENLLLHRMRLRRMEAEAIRDRILSVSTGLDLRLGGPSVPIYLTPFMQGRGRPAVSGPVDGMCRRSVYLEVRRNFLSPFFLAFDTPIPASTLGRRMVSNVPAQALSLLNDPFVQAESRRWAQRLLATPAQPAPQLIEHMYECALGRPPTAFERENALAFLAEQGIGHGRPPEDPLPSLEAWADLCHVLFNVKEFIFVN